MTTQTNSDRPHVGLKAILVRFGGGFTVGGWAALLLSIALARVLFPPAGDRGQCGNAPAMVIVAGFILHTGLQGVGALLCCAAGLLPVPGLSRGGTVWLVIATGSFLLSFGLILWLRSM